MIILGALAALLVAIGVIVFIIVKAMIMALLVVLAGVYAGAYMLVSKALPSLDIGWHLLGAAVLGTVFLYVMGLIFGREKLQFWQPRQKPWWDGIKTPRYMPCPCGSGVPFYRCHEAMENERQKQRQRVEDAKQYAVSPEDSGN